MKYDFLNVFSTPESLPNQSMTDINPFLLENNSNQIKQIYEFYKDNVNLLYVNGFLGTGKAEIINYSLQFLSTETVVLKYNCFNSTVLDDILLSFFKDFKNLSSRNIISEPKIKTENFTQKVNSYFSQIEKPFLVILDSFEAILEENRSEILDFIFHLHSMQKVKIIIIGRTFEGKYFKDVPLLRVTTYSLDRQIFDKYLKAEKIKAQPAIYEELYKHTRGYYFFTAFSIKLMNTQKLSLVDFLTKLKESYLPYFKFLENQALNLVAPEQRNMFWFLSLIRHPVSVDLLKKLNFYQNEEKINFLIENLIMIKDEDNIYVQDYLKDELDQSTYAHVLQKIRYFIIDLYSSQLPLKPLERDICISRQTMRKEIEFHKLFLPKRLKSSEGAAIDLNYLTYSKTMDVKENNKPEPKPSLEQKDNKPSVPQLDLTQRKNVSLNLENLIFQPKDRQKNVPNGQIEERVFSFRELLELINEAESKYEYPNVIELCQQAILMKTDRDYAQKLPELYTKLAYAYQEIAEHENSLKYYELVLDLYQRANQIKKVNYIKFNIAKILYATYRIDKAKEMFTEIAQSPDSPPSLIVRSFIQLAGLAEDSSTPESAHGYYKQAIDNSNEMMDVEILSELYFKYALVMDDKNDLKSALAYYNKCINLSSDPKTNTFLSSAYSNVATLYLENNDIANSVKYYKLSYEMDSESDNFEGAYYAASRLATMLQRKMPNDALKYFEAALEYAQKIKDVFYIISASLALGDFYYDMKRNEAALKLYLQSLDLAQNNLSKDNIYKINVRLNDLKYRLGTDNFDKLADFIRGQE